MAPAAGGPPDDAPGGPLPLAQLLEESAEELYEEAPCGYLSTLPDGTIVKVNRTFLEWTGHTREQLLGKRRFADLLTAGGRIYHETHYAPLLAMQGAVREIAVELRRADRSRLPVLVNSVLKRDGDGRALLIRTTVFIATDRMRYERELLLARDRERALHEQEAEVAQALQRSMLESVALRDPRVGIGTYYRPAVQTLQVGGDWHDAFPLGDGRIGLVVGDVVGRGIEAATAMGQLRSATRALAGAGLGGPAAVIAALDRFAAGLPRALMATLVYAEVELASGTTRFVCAGHPPPVLLPPAAGPIAPAGDPAAAAADPAAPAASPSLAGPPDPAAPAASPSLAGPADPAAARVLDGGRWLPLGVAADGERPVEGQLTLAPGARLLLYTDGLIERREESLDRGLSRLLAVADDAARIDDPQTLVDELAETLTGERDARDDVCALCAQLRAGPGAETNRPAGRPADRAR